MTYTVRLREEAERNEQRQHAGGHAERKERNGGRNRARALLLDVVVGHRRAFHRLPHAWAGIMP